MSNKLTKIDNQDLLNAAIKVLGHDVFTLVDGCHIMVDDDQINFPEGRPVTDKEVDQILKISKEISKARKLSETINLIKKEAQNRIAILLNATDDNNLTVKISNDLREALSLEHKRLGTPDPDSDGWIVPPAEWTIKEKRRSLELRIQNQAIDFIREKSNELEAMEPIPEDFQDDKYWT